MADISEQASEQPPQEGAGAADVEVDPDVEVAATTEPATPVDLAKRTPPTPVDQPAAAPDPGPAPDPAPADPWAPPAADAPPPPAAAPAAAPWPRQPGPYDGYRQPPFAPYDAQPPTHRGTNGLAVTSLVTGLTCCLWPAALGFGIASLVQLRRRRQSGRGLAVAGVVLGVLGLLASVLAGVGGVVGFRAAQVAARDNGFGLQPGQCFTQQSGPAGVTGWPRVDCSAPHYGEVTARIKLTGDEFPGTVIVQQQSNAVCRTAEQAYLTDLWARSSSVSVRYIYPNTEARWENTDQTTICFLHDSSPGGGVGTLRRDATDLTQDQQDFLQAVNGLDDAEAEEPTDDPSGDIGETQNWIDDTASGISEAADTLGRRDWPAGSKDEVAALVRELQNDQAAWQAARNDNTTPLDDLVDQLTAHDLARAQAEGAARRALGLADQDERQGAPDDTQPGGGSGGSGDGTGTGSGGGNPAAT
ncbi:DUF4190 domain-containing protein [Kitasatospora sp. NBC_01287]|uniref:DUF4190 domain-containing protein n=1 Tax=Kitasatospora sp. NBC_01287 TaxID=2903573 RepID=UPI002257910E|nr:DUF4190 domain-containing protein [Kitasatospora sp. NBC_01287]MCX4745525.1 DUF4190 domain-containing protein [Kitasatospora sp. NBC_01287]